MGAVARASGLDPDVLDAQLLLVLLDRDGDVHLPVLPMAALDAAPDECVLLAAPGRREIIEDVQHAMQALFVLGGRGGDCRGPAVGDRKSTRLNSSHVAISYAVFCLKKKNNS